MRYFGLSICLLFLIACSEQVERADALSNEMTDFDSSAVAEMDFGPLNAVDTVLIDSVQLDSVFLTKDQEDLLETEVKEFVSDKEYQEIVDAIKHRQTIATAEDLHKYYSDILPKARWALTEGMTKSHPDVIYSGDSEPADDWQFITKLIPDLVAECLCGECMSEAHILTNKMYELALTTPSKEDDKFFAFSMEVYYYGWEDREETAPGEDDKIFDNSNDGFAIHDHCCICYYNSLGDYFHFNTLEFAFSNEWDMYQDEVNNIVDDARFGDYNYNFYYEKSEVLGEIKALEELALNKEFKDGLVQLKKRIETGQDIFYGCQTGECPSP